MTKQYTMEERELLYDTIMDASMTTRILQTGVAAAAAAKPNVLLARALGFNYLGKFSVNRERPEGSKNKWQRYFPKGCPELLEYLARVDTLQGEEFTPDNHFQAELARGSETHIKYTVEKEEPSAELVSWAAQLPDWGELYTPAGLNFYVLYHLYRMEHGVAPNHKQLLQICDQYDSPYKIRFCQGEPKNDADLELHYTNDTRRLLGMRPEPESEEEPLPTPELVVSNVDRLEKHLDKLLADKEQLELEEAWNVIRGMAANMVSFADELTKPSNLAEARRMIRVLEEIGTVCEELASLERFTSV